MKIRIHETARALALDAAADGAERIRQAIRDKGNARIMLSTGASQFALLAALVAQEIDWSKVEWLKSGQPWQPDVEKSLAENGLKHKDVIRLRTPGLTGIKGSFS